MGIEVTHRALIDSTPSMLSLPIVSIVTPGFPQGGVIDEPTVDAWRATAPRMNGKYTKKWIKDALAITAYHAQRAPPVPIVPLLIGDDAPQRTMLTEEVAPCWVHDGRVYKCLLPRLEHHKLLVVQILTEFWALYHALRAYQAVPNPEAADRLRGQFAALVAQQRATQPWTSV